MLHVCLAQNLHSARRHFPVCNLWRSMPGACLGLVNPRTRWVESSCGGILREQKLFEYSWVASEMIDSWFGETS